MRASILKVAFAAVLGLSGCLSGFRFSGTPAPAPLFQPEQFFAGRTTGEGILATRFSEDRSFRVEGSGHCDIDGTFVLDQTITYADGAVEQRSFRIWHVRKHEYVATLTGASGLVSASAEGNAFRMRYTIRKPAITMEQWLYLQNDGRTALNLATVRVFGVPVAHLSETIKRE